MKFCVEIFSWSGATMKLYLHKNLFTYLEKMEDYNKDLMAFMCIVKSRRRLLGKCLSIKENQKTLQQSLLLSFSAFFVLYLRLHLR